MNNLIKAIEARAYLCEPSLATRDELKEADIWLDALHLINEAVEGKVLVPVYPTTEMIEAAARHCYAHEESYGVVETQTRLDAIRVYKVMLEKAK